LSLVFLSPHIKSKKMKLAAIKKVFHLGRTVGCEHDGRILILDGSDAVGHRVVKSLVDAGVADVRVGVRTPLKEQDPTSIMERVPFVWGDESTYSAAL
jgi:hypothetical protein